MALYIVSSLLLIMVVYYVYIVYNLVVLVPKYGFRLLKFPFCSKVWRLSLLNSDWNCSNDDPIDVDDYTVEYEDCDPILSPDYKRGYDNGYVIGREEGELAASCNELTVKDLIKDSIDDGDFALVQQLTFKLIQNNQI